MIDTPPGCGPPLFNAGIKVQPDDFQVDEVLGFELDGAGEHLYLHIEKTGCNTDEVVSLLEAACAAQSADSGVAGMKDRHAVTRQWFSVRSPADIEAVTGALGAFNKSQAAQSDPPLKSLRLLSHTRHSRKLRRGAHQGNDFVIVLRNVQALALAQAQPMGQGVCPEASASEDWDASREFGSAVPLTTALETPLAALPTVTLAAALEVRLESLRRNGFPNYLGAQRFGRGGENLVRARQWFRQPRKRTSRQQRSLWLSAARSALFNAVCAARVDAGNWQQILPGEPVILAGTRSYFDQHQASTDELSERLAAMDVHPSGPWWGRGRSAATDECAAFENEVLADHKELCAGLEQSGLPQERRALRAQAATLSASWRDVETLELRFGLSPGVFATSLLRELGMCLEPDRTKPGGSHA